MDIPNGFTEIGTGGNCTAWERQLNPGHALISCDLTAPKKMDDPCEMGIYDMDGELIRADSFDSVTGALNVLEGT